MLFLFILTPSDLSKRLFSRDVDWLEGMKKVFSYGPDTSVENKDDSQCSSVFHSYYNYESLPSHLSTQLFIFLFFGLTIDTQIYIEWMTKPAQKRTARIKAGDSSHVGELS